MVEAFDETIFDVIETLHDKSTETLKSRHANRNAELSFRLLDGVEIPLRGDVKDGVCGHRCSVNRRANTDFAP